MFGFHRSGSGRALILAAVLLTALILAPTSSLAAVRKPRLVFSEDFSGTVLDSAKWRSCYPWARPAGCSTWTNNELQWYQDSQIRVGGGAASLVASRETTLGETEAGAPQTFDWRSGMITTGGKFSFAFGKVVVRARIPAGKGFWPALWLLPVDSSWPPEIDIMEAVGEAPSQVTLSYRESLDRMLTSTVPTADLSAGWHTFTLDWKPDSLTWSVDGVQRYRLTGPVTGKPMYLLANLAVGGTFPQPPDATTPSTASFAIDRVQIWQDNPGTGSFTQQEQQQMAQVPAKIGPRLPSNSSCDPTLESCSPWITREAAATERRRLRSAADELRAQAAQARQGSYSKWEELDT